MAAPQPQIALWIQGAADRRELCPVLVQRLQRQRTAAKAHLAGLAVGHDMDGFDPGAILQGASHLGQGALVVGEHHAFDFRSQPGKKRVEVGDPAIDEGDFPGACRRAGTHGHGCNFRHLKLLELICYSKYIFQQVGRSDAANSQYFAFISFLVTGWAKDMAVGRCFSTGRESEPVNQCLAGQGPVQFGSVRSSRRDAGTRAQ
jgi:hypothetical protein